MHQPLTGFWQLSPLTDLTLPQADLEFPAVLSSVLPVHVSEQQIAEQEWHLMHDIEVDEAMLGLAAIDLVIEGINHYAEVRVGGVAVYDCDGSRYRYQKDIKEYLNLGKNRIEILFLDQEEDWLIDEQATVCHLDHQQAEPCNNRVGIKRAPFLRLIRSVRLHHVSTEQIWHHGGGCELKVDVYYHSLKPGLVAADIKYNGMTYTVPLDIRSDHVSAIFQIDAPQQALLSDDSRDVLSGATQLFVHLDGYHFPFDIGLSETQCVSHYPL
ncbi:glycosyl hydrolase 2 galactose-binding domain-containing protein [Vibrio algicola]|uniref:Beta-mannosidase-like galactose-binding domain-containing protein n=1 Tax=Vibrio algicola TaxID=2662262 RepID=A0A5Q0TB52_9VIBR|nr:sugar-binding domain-containing protein [Vibrio algicola]